MEFPVNRPVPELFPTSHDFGLAKVSRPNCPTSTISPIGSLVFGRILSSSDSAGCTIVMIGGLIRNCRTIVTHPYIYATCARRALLKKLT
jgi:hypothetical protein